MGTLVLIGGTGSLGTAILNQQALLKKYGVTKIRIISRDEIKQAEVERRYSGSIELQCFLGDVRDSVRMDFALERADYVIHMAALKMIERFEKDIPEGYRTNIDGTENVAKAAVKNKLKSAIFVSTDKAFKPINAYGVSKLAAMHLWQWFNTFQTKTKFGVCAYGNVWGSRGSVIERWQNILLPHHDIGDLLYVTHPEMTRFFITRENAAKFVINSLFKNKKEIMFPKMKSAEMKRIAELMLREARVREDNIEITGLRDPREKLHEDLGEMNSFTAPRFTDDEIVKMIRCN